MMDALMFIPFLFSPFYRAIIYLPILRIFLDSISKLYTWVKRSVM